MGRSYRIRKNKYLRYSLYSAIFMFCILYTPMLFYRLGLPSYLSIVLGNYIYVVGFMFWFYKKKKYKKLKWPLIIAFILISGASYYFINSLGNENFKNKGEIGQYKQHTHPVLKYYTVILSVFDPDMVITDSKRRPQDYEKMNLPEFKGSLHYVQKDGYSHAIDLRTKGRTSIRNWLVRAYYYILGYTAIQHKGSAMHIHVDDRKIFKNR